MADSHIDDRHRAARAGQKPTTPSARSPLQPEAPLEIGFKIRKWFLVREETRATELGAAADGEPLVKIAVAAVVANPHAGEFGPDLAAIVEKSAALGEAFGRRLVEAAGRPIESYGKACIVGMNGEYEHGNAFLTTAFADPIRRAIGGGKAWIASTGKRAPAGSSIDVPLAHKDALYVRSHYDTMTLTFGDAPGPDEVVVIVVAATRGRLRARLGGIKATEITGRDGLR